MRSILRFFLSLSGGLLNLRKFSNMSDKQQPQSASGLWFPSSIHIMLAKHAVHKSYALLLGMWSLTAQFVVLELTSNHRLKLQPCWQELQLPLFPGKRHFSHPPFIKSSKALPFATTCNDNDRIMILSQLAASSFVKQNSAYWPRELTTSPTQHWLFNRNSRECTMIHNKNVP